MKYYKISEAKLKEFLEASLELYTLHSYQVDKWHGYMQNWRDILQDFYPDEDVYDDDFEKDFSDVAEMLLKDYEVINE